MKILDLENLDYKRVARKDIITVEVFIKYFDLLNFSLKDMNAYLVDYWNSLTDKMADKTANYEVIIAVEDRGVRPGEEAGLRQNIGDSFIEWLIESGMRKEENRLSIPKGLVCKVGRIRFLQLVNRKTKVNNITCSISINGKSDRVF